MNVGCCYDDYVGEKLKYFIPKNKSYLKEKNLKPWSEISDDQKKREKMDRLKNGVQNYI